jgi:hypothetical protein
MDDPGFLVVKMFFIGVGVVALIMVKDAIKERFKRWREERKNKNAEKKN